MGVCVAVYVYVWTARLKKKKDYHDLELPNPRKADFNNYEVLLSVALNLPLLL